MNVRRWQTVLFQLKRQIWVLLLLLFSPVSVLAEEAGFSHFSPISETTFPAFPLAADSLQDIRLHQLELDEYYRHDLQTFTRRLEAYRRTLEEARQSLEAQREDEEQVSIDAWRHKEQLRHASVEWEQRRQALEQQRTDTEQAFSQGNISRPMYVSQLDEYRQGIVQYKAFHERYRRARAVFDRAHQSFSEYLERTYRPGIDAYQRAVRESLEPEQQRQRLLMARYEERRLWCLAVIDELKSIEEETARQETLARLKEEAGL
ncbi:hypothetical protein BGP77_17035 [Saccharospirillum sp. MSK14-1]|uniref:hypothetical protein n=1 Tax=Saccharospirillum sp. MSK14-1 TaxID=1897632 RepID=UPI000D3ADE11|nr:hypothetical protein [Saccharospirillum sp. MSK14-1]PTY38150.1 hypothetical protein BGP77_17035 [Saccharospirillum sp. MSK14-1]